MTRRRLTPSQKAAILERLYLSGASIRTVAAEIGSNRETVRQHLKARGLIRGRLDYHGDARERVLGCISYGAKDDCWLWTGSVNNMGYGIASYGGHGRAAHRLIYELLIGPVPADLDCCHICDNPRCVRPDHMFIGTRKDNMQDAASKGRLRRGDRCPSAVLTEATVRQALASFRAGRRICDIARDHGVNYKLMHSALRGPSWQWIKKEAA